jgi:hypothetical protein
MIDLNKIKMNLSLDPVASKLPFQAKELKINKRAVYSSLLNPS